MTTQEFAEAHGLTLEEAQLILARRQPPLSLNSRLEKAREALERSQKKVGVHPVEVTGVELTHGYDPDADVGKREFYEEQAQGGSVSTPWRIVGEWDEFNQDPDK